MLEAKEAMRYYCEKYNYFEGDQIADGVCFSIIKEKDPVIEKLE